MLLNHKYYWHWQYGADAVYWDQGRVWGGALNPYRMDMKGQWWLLVITEQLAAVPKLANLGPLFKSSSTPLELTESETEYVVRCIKHTFPHHIVFQVILVAVSQYPCLLIAVCVAK